MRPNPKDVLDMMLFVTGRRLGLSALYRCGNSVSLPGRELFH
jgi:hypothetical protein